MSPTESRSAVNLFDDLTLRLGKLRGAAKPHAPGRENGEVRDGDTFIEVPD